MKIVIRSSSVSPHQAPFALALSKLMAEGDVVMMYTGKPADPFRATGVFDTVAHIAKHWEGSDADFQAYDSADVVLENHRDYEIMERRLRAGKRVYHQSERWFKPEKLKFLPFYVPGFIKMFLPFAIRRARTLMRLMQYDGFTYLPIGIHAATDMARMCGLMHGDLRCLFRAPKLLFEKNPCGRIHAVDGHDDRYCLDKMRLWAYFVSASENQKVREKRDASRVLWVGRLLDWKRVDTLIKAIINDPSLTVDIVGDGPDKCKLERLAAECDRVSFHGSVPLSDVRKLMKTSGIYVLTSNAWEGWGAVVNEALEEGMTVVGTSDAGGSATLLPEENLFKAGDVSTLNAILRRGAVHSEIGLWSVNCAAKEFLTFIQ